MIIFCYYLFFLQLFSDFCDVWHKERENNKIILLGICVLRDSRSRNGLTFLVGVCGRGARGVTCKVVPFLLNDVYGVMG